MHAELATDFLRRQPASVKVEVLHQALARQDLQSLAMLREIGLFREGAKPGVFAGLERYTDGAHPIFSAVASVNLAANEAVTSQDPVSGQAYGSMVGLRGMHAPKGLKDVVHELLQGFLHEFRGSDPWAPANTEAKALERDTTLAAFLAAGAAMNDPSLIRAAFITSIMAKRATSDWESPDHKQWLDGSVDPIKLRCFDCIHPVLIAIEYGHTEALDAFIEAGWRPSSPVAKLNEEGVQTARTLEDLVIPDDGSVSVFELMGCGNGIFILPGMIAKLALLHEQHQQPDRGPDAHTQAYRFWASKLLGAAKDTGDIEMVKTLIDTGAYDHDVQGSFLLAAKHGNRQLIDRLATRVDWGGFDVERNPVFQALLNGSAWSEREDELRACTMCVMDLAIAAGRGDLLGVPRGYGASRKAMDLPLIACVKHEAEDLLVRCLDAGADPHAPDVTGDSAMSAAKKYGDQRMMDIMRSSHARRAAAAAVTEIMGHAPELRTP